MTNPYYIDAWVPGEDVAKTAVHDVFRGQTVISTTVAGLQAMDTDGHIVAVIETAAGDHVIYKYDSTDTTSADDGDAVLVSNDGQRFKKKLSISGADIVAAINAALGASTWQAPLNDAAVVAAFGNEVPAASQAEAEAGTEEEIRQWSPERVAQAIAALGGGGGGGGAGYPQMIYSEEYAKGTTDVQGSAGSYNKRVLNTEHYDENGTGTLVSGGVSLPAGTYYMMGWSFTQRGQRNKTRIRHETNTPTTHAVGFMQNAQSSNNVGHTNVVAGYVTLAATETVELQHYVSNNGSGVNNLGVKNEESGDSENDMFALLLIWEVA